MPGPLKLGALRSTHPRVDLAYTERLRAMYKGGQALLRNIRVMRQVFPSHPREGSASYEERIRRAFYDQDMAMVINKIMAGLNQDPLHFDDDGASKGKRDAKPIPDYWANLEKDARSPSETGPRKTFAQKIEQSLLEGIICGMGWMLCDLPRKPVAADGTSLVVSRADEERWQVDRAYPVPYRADQVLDWMDEDDTLMWVKTHDVRDAMREPGDVRGEFQTHTWRIWDAETITTYQLTLDAEGKDRDKREWKPDDLVSPIEDPVEHTFGMVPWVCFDAAVEDEPTLWLADALESRCRQLFGVANDDDHLRRIGSYPQLYEFLGRESGGPDDVIGENQSNPYRATRRMDQRGPDVIQIRGGEDKAAYVEPTMAAAAANRAALEEGREQVPRIVGMLAYLNDTSGALIKRSAASKKQDGVSEQVIMGSIGLRGLAFANAVKEMLARGRKESLDELPRLKGYENFDTEDAASRIEEYVALAQSPIKSATFQVEHQVQVVKAILGNTASAETMATVREDLESSITQEQFDEPVVHDMAQQQDKDKGPQWGQ